MKGQEEPAAWQTPLKDLDMARVLFNDIRTWFRDRQQQEYDEQVMRYLDCRQPTGMPFIDDFSSEPDQIIQIKQLANALYLTEIVFAKLAGLNIASPATYQLELIQEAYTASHQLLNIASQFEGVFKQEIAQLSGYAGIILQEINTSADSPQKTSQASPLESLPYAAQMTGHTLGRSIQQMSVGDSDLLTYFGAVFPTYPAHIEAVRLHIEKHVARHPEQTVRVNEKKIDMLLKKGRKLNHIISKISKSKKNPLYLVFNVISLMRQTQFLLSEVSQEAGNLNDTLQGLIREQLAMLKYELLPGLFASVDKLEVQLMLKPGRLSKPLMDQLKPWYEALTQTAKYVVDFETQGEKLLKLEDSRFIELRLAAARQQLEASKQALHLVTPALKAVNDYLNDATPEPDKKALLVQLKNHVVCLGPYLTHMDKALKSQLDSLVIVEPNWGHYFYDLAWGTKHNPTDANIKSWLVELKKQMEQVKTNQEFMIPRVENLMASIQNNDRRVIFPYNEPVNIFHVSEKNAFFDRKTLPSQLTYSDQDGTLSISNPDALTNDEAWDVYRWNENKLANMQQALVDCETLLTAMETQYRGQPATRPIVFNSGYTVALMLNQDRLNELKIDYGLDERDYSEAALVCELKKQKALDENMLLEGGSSCSQHQPNQLYVKIEEGSLKYEVLEPLNTGCKLYLMSLEKALTEGHRGYVWNSEKNQLSYISPDGHVLNKIPLESTVYLKLLIKRNRKKIDQDDGLALTKDQVNFFITDFGGHHPGVIHRGIIPLSELNCPLTSLTSTAELTPYLATLLAQAIERGHIHDEFRSQCIQQYSAIQPYLVSAFQNDTDMDIQAFDKKVAHVFSGQFYKSTSPAQPVVSFTEFSHKLIALKFRLLREIPALENRCSVYAAKVANKTFSIHKPDIEKSILHQEFSPDVAEFMTSMEPLKRQIHESNKTLFRVALDLQKNASKQPLDAYLKKVQAYESAQIERNEQILASAIKKSRRDLTSPERVIPAVAFLSESEAFMHLCDVYEPRPLIQGKDPDPKQLQINIQDGLLHYQFLHYGVVLRGEIPVDRINPPLTDYNPSTVVSNDTLSSILRIAYDKRTIDLVSNDAEVSFDEALELYQWYLTHEKELTFADREHSDAFHKKVVYYRKEVVNKHQLNIDHKPIEIKRKDRTDHLFKHEKISANLSEVKNSIEEHIKYLNDSMQRELARDSNVSGVPYPDVSCENWLTKPIETVFRAGMVGGLMKLPTIIGQLPYFNEERTPVMITSLQNPRQVLAIKRLINIVYYLEKLMSQLEDINDNEAQVPYVMHLVISFLYYQDIQPLVTELANDPALSAIYGDMMLKIESVSRMLGDEKKYYIDEASQDDNQDRLVQQQGKNTTLLQLINVLKMLPRRVSLPTELFIAEHAALKANSQNTVDNIEKITAHYMSSSYVRLLFDLPQIKSLVEELTNNMSTLLGDTHRFAQTSLDRINTEFLTKILLEADEMEGKLGLKPGLLSGPLKEILDEFYKGFITQLEPDVDKRIELLCKPEPILERIQAVEHRIQHAGAQVEKHQRELDSMQLLLNACDATQVPKKDEDMFLDFLYLNDMYELHLPLLKKALNGSDLHLMSLQEAKDAGHRDCLIWDEPKLQLFYIDQEGSVKPQIQIKNSAPIITLIRRKMRECRSSTQLYLSENEIRELGTPNSDLVLIKHGVTSKKGCSFISMPSVPSNFYELNLSANYNSFYVQVEGENNALYFIDRDDSSIKRLPILEGKQAEAKKILSSIRKNQLLLSDDFKKITKLAPSATPLPYAPEPRGALASDDLLPDSTGLLLAEEMMPVPEPEAKLTHHTCQASFMSNIDNFVVDEESIPPFRSLLTHCKAYYEGLKATEEMAVATLKQQLSSLRTVQAKQTELNEKVKLTLFTDHDNEKIEALCKEKMGLQGYELGFLTDTMSRGKDNLKPDYLYVRIINDTTLQYRVLDHRGVVKKGQVELSEIHWPVGKKLVSQDKLTDLIDYLPAILKKTSERGHTRPQSLRSDYQKALKLALLEGQKTRVDRAMELNASVINSDVNAKKTVFDAKNIDQYRELEKINQAVYGFRLYLNDAENHWTTRRALFESTQTIKNKRIILCNIENVAAQSDVPVDIRIQTIKELLQKPATLSGLMGFVNQEPSRFAQLFQCIMHLFEAVGLYTPKAVQHTDKLFEIIETSAPDSEHRGPQTFRLFSETTREKIQSSIDRVAPDEPSDEPPPVISI